jgi:hypothetical protein
MDTTASNDSKSWAVCHERLVDDKANEVFEIPESSDVLAVADWFED